MFKIERKVFDYFSTTTLYSTLLRFGLAVDLAVDTGNECGNCCFIFKPSLAVVLREIYSLEGISNY